MYMDENETITVTLTLDSGDELECQVLTTLEAGGRKYIALFPISGPGSEDERSICTASSNTATRNRIWKTSQMTPNLLLPPMPTMHGWKNRTLAPLIWTICKVRVNFQTVLQRNGKEKPPFRFLFLHNRF